MDDGTEQSPGSELHLCDVCLELKSSDAFPPPDDFPPGCKPCALLGLGHDGRSNLCSICCRDVVKHGMTEMLQVGCPVCGRRCELHQLTAFASKETFETCETRMTHQSLERDSTFRWCGQQTCTSGQFYDIATVTKDPKICCGHCGGVNCYNCRDSFHEGMTCDEYRAHLAMRKSRSKTSKTYSLDASTLQSMRQGITRQCPSCKTAVQKNGGCDHMKCKSSQQLGPPQVLTDLTGSTCGSYFDWDEAEFV